MNEVKIPEGYKQTELGILPKDWNIEPLENFTSYISYGFTNPMPTTLIGPYMITARDIINGKIQYETARKTDLKAFEKSLTQKSRPKEKDILLTKDGTLGRVAIAGKKTICINQSVALLRPNSRINPSFFKHLLESNYYQNKMLEDAGGSTIKHIYITIVNKMSLGVPNNLEEQTAIATALSDVDNLIQSLEKLIAKKEAIKTGTMQQLLTGKTRLPEFATRDDGSIKGFKQTELGRIPEDWEVRKLNQISDVKSGGTPSTSDSSYWNGSILWCTPTDITALKSQKYLSNTLKKITKAGLKNSSAELLPIGSIVMTSRATIGECAITTKNISTNQGFKNFICFDNTNNEFLYYNLSNSKNRLVQLCSGSTFLEISTTQTRNFEIAVPSIQEQTAIATILSDMDTEIQALQERLEKTKDIKQGMMQQLLTGKMRLLDSSAKSDTQTLASKGELQA